MGTLEILIVWMFKSKQPSCTRILGKQIIRVQKHDVYSSVNKDKIKYIKYIKICNPTKHRPLLWGLCSQQESNSDTWIQNICSNVQYFIHNSIKEKLYQM